MPFPVTVGYEVELSKVVFFFFLSLYYAAGLVTVASRIHFRVVTTYYVTRIHD